MAIFFCSRCGVALTRELTELPAVPEFKVRDGDRDKKTRLAPSTVPAGHYAVETEPWGAPYIPHDPALPVPARPRFPTMLINGSPAISAGAVNTFVVHPDDVPGLRPLPDLPNDHGCCGPSGTGGLNRSCPCGAPVAALTADCLGPHELHLDPVRTYAFDQRTGSGLPYGMSARRTGKRRSRSRRHRNLRVRLVRLRWWERVIKRNSRSHHDRVVPPVPHRTSRAGPHCPPGLGTRVPPSR